MLRTRVRISDDEVLISWWVLVEGVGECLKGQLLEND